MGGARRAALELTRRMVREHDVTVYELLLASEEQMTWPAGATVERTVVDDARIGRWNRRLAELALMPLWLRAQGQVAAHIDQSGPDALVVHPCRVTQSPHLITRVQVPTVYFMQEIRRVSYEAGYRAPPRRIPGNLARGLDRVVDAWPKRIDRRAVAAADVLACNSAFTGEAILRTYGRVAHISYLGVDEERFVLPVRSTDAACPYVLVAGGLEPLKDPALVIRAVGTIDIVGRPAVVVVGERTNDHYVDGLRNLARELSVELIVSKVDDEELVELYQNAAVTCCASRLEPFGLTAVESLACGTPVVAVNEGGYREVVVDGYNGRLVPRDPMAMGRAIRSFMDGSPWSADALRCSVIPRFTWDSAMHRLQSIIDSLVTNAQRGDDS